MRNCLFALCFLIPMLGNAQSRPAQDRIFFQIGFVLAGETVCSRPAESSCSLFGDVQASSLAEARVHFGELCRNISEVKANCECYAVENTPQANGAALAVPVQTLPQVTDLTLVIGREKLNARGEVDLNAPIGRMVDLASCRMAKQGSTPAPNRPSPKTQ